MSQYGHTKLPYESENVPPAKYNDLLELYNVSVDTIRTTVARADEQERNYCRLESTLMTLRTRYTTLLEKFVDVLIEKRDEET